jgi:hypothetical protein
MTRREDPVLRSARREAVIVFFTWVAAVAYTVAYCARYGYNRPVESLTFVLWFPDWVFWGIVAPWLACAAFSLWFAWGVMRDEDLGSDADEGVGDRWIDEGSRDAH